MGGQRQRSLAARQLRWHEKLRRRESEGGAGIHFPHTPFFCPPRPSGLGFCETPAAFRSKWVRVLSIIGHHIELAASLGCSFLASAGGQKGRGLGGRNF